jgi:hypothetical protein
MEDHLLSEKDAKKPAARDISDLKARLGLKKGEGGPGRATGVLSVPGVVPSPSAAKIGRAVPPPPGVAPPPGEVPEAAPSIPDARVDPFAAMNAMAQQGAAAQAVAPIVIVHDGQPVESVQKGQKLRYAKYAAMLLVPLIIGRVMGGISYQNQVYNKTIDDAKSLKDGVVEVGKSLQRLQDTLLIAKERGADKQSFLVGDKDLVAALDELKLVAPEAESLYHTNLYHLDPILVSDTLKWYSDLGLLYERVKRHVTLSKGDLKKVRKGDPALAALGGRTQFGAVINMPKDAQSGPPLLQLGEIGAPLCAPQGTAFPAGCPGGAPPIGFQFRSDVANPNWVGKPWSGSTVSADNVLLVGDSAVFTALVRGSEPFVDAINYMQRIQEIDALATSLIDQKKSIENRLNQKAQEGKRFAL